MAHVGHGAVECEAQSKFTPRRHLPCSCSGRETGHGVVGPLLWDERGLDDIRLDAL